MHTVEAKRVVDRPRAEVWAMLTDFSNVSRWMPEEVKGVFLGGSHEEGAALNFERTVTGRLIECSVETVEWEPETGFAWRSVEERANGEPIEGYGKIYLRFRLADAGGNRTEVTITASWESVGMIRNLASRTVVAKVVRDDLQKMLSRL